MTNNNIKMSNNIELEKLVKDNIDTIKINIDDTYDFICCICLEENHTDVVYLQCCKHDIHKMCFVSWILTKGVNFNCPICRETIISLNQLISLNDIFDNIFNKFPKNNKSKIDNANAIIHQYWYINEGDDTISINLETSNNTRHRQNILTHYNIFRICNNTMCSIFIIGIIGFFIFTVQQSLLIKQN